MSLTDPSLTRGRRHQWTRFLRRNRAPIARALTMLGLGVYALDVLSFYWVETSEERSFQILTAMAMVVVAGVAHLVRAWLGPSRLLGCAVGAFVIFVVCWVTAYTVQARYVRTSGVGGVTSYIVVSDRAVPEVLSWIDHRRLKSRSIPDLEQEDFDDLLFEFGPPIGINLRLYDPSARSELICTRKSLGQIRMLLAGLTSATAVFLALAVALFVERAIVAYASKRPSTASRELEARIRSDLPYLNVAEWRERLAVIEGQVCRVETPGNLGSGFLVGPDLVLTAYHVVKDVINQTSDAPQVVIRFDYESLLGGGEKPGTIVRLANDWLVDWSPYSQSDLLANAHGLVPGLDELDYALIRLAEALGNRPIGGVPAVPGVPARGWLRPKLDYAFPADAPIFIIEHPKGQPMQLAMDTRAVIGENANKTRVRYRTNTEEGSSGAPVFDQAWDLVALHHSGDTKKVPVYNQGIPMKAISDLLAHRKHPLA